MQRPSSIVAFERLYLGSLAVYLINGLVFWSTNRELVNAMGQVRASSALAELITPIMVGALVVTALVSLLFWYLVARRRSVVGKWLVVVTEAIGGVTALFALLRLVSGTAPNPPGTALSILSTGLAVAAAAMLFRADARDWLGEGSMLDDRA